MDVYEPVGIGSDFLGYRIEELLGRGGMGVVYRAYDLRLKRPIALKLVAPALARDERFRERFTRETELVMSLEHPNVVPIYDAGDFDGRVYLAMRLVDGRDLGSLLETEGALEPARAVAICGQIAAALDAAHARGLVHRDVKPSNVLLDGSDHVYLADFGLTRRLDDEDGVSAEEFAVGTPAYLAPEQVEGGPVDGRADVYALGCVLYECLTGEPVFPRSSRLAVAWAHLEDEPPRPSRMKRSLPERVDGVISRALAKQPADRFPSCCALMLATEQALGLRRSAHRRTAAIAASAVAVAVAASLAIAHFVGGGGASAVPRTHANSLVRIDPRTSKVQRVIDVAARPWAMAASGRTVWVYSRIRDVISEVDARANRVLEATRVAIDPVILPTVNGPVLAADSYGAWIVGLDSRGHGVVTLVPGGVGRPHGYPLGGRPVAVATGLHTVWVVDDGARSDRLLSLDPLSGTVRVRARFPLSSGADALAVGFKNVWVVGSTTGTLYRFNPRAKTVRHVNLGQRAGRPAVIFDHIWVGVSDLGASDIALVDPLTLQTEGAVNGGVGTGVGTDYAVLAGSLWGYDVANGEVQKWHPPRPAGAVSVTDAPAYDGACMTSLTAGDGAVWVSLAPSIQSACALFR